MQNADPQELEKFGELAHRWWDPDGEFRPLHQINPLRLSWINQKVNLAPGVKALDVGCGGGILAESMARTGADVLGVDLSVKPLKIARLHALEAGVPCSYREVAVEDLANEAPASFDLITCMEMLEHVPDPCSVVHSCAALAKSNGWVFFSTLNRNPKSFLLAVFGAEYVLNMLPRGTHEYARFLKPSELAGMARQAGLTLFDSIGLTYNPIKDRYSLTPRTTVNYLLAFRKT